MKGDGTVKNQKIVLAGNPNVGKSVFFNALTGIYADVSNFPGTTVDISMGHFLGNTVIDTPGVYGLSSFNDEEKVAKDVIVQADIVINVVDSTKLARDLFLTRQLIDMGLKVIVCLNLMDEAERNDVIIDAKALEAELGVPVVATAAAKDIGINELKDKIGLASKGRVNQQIKAFADKYAKVVATPAEALLAAEDDSETLDKYGLTAGGDRETIYRLRRADADRAAAAAVRKAGGEGGWAEKLGDLMVSPVYGIFFMIAALAVFFVFVGWFIAQVVVEFTEGYVMDGLYKPFIISLLAPLTEGVPFIKELLIGQFGVLTMLPVYVMGLLLPLVAGFYLLLSFFEDTGYLPRVAALTDSLFSKIGLNGRAIIPIILGLGCVTVATVSTRILGSRRERVIATALLGLAIPCSAQTGVVMGMISRTGVFYTLIYIVSIALVFGLAGLALNAVLPGVSTGLLIDLPRIRLPQLSNVLKKTYFKTKNFFFEAVPLFALGAAILTLLDVTGGLKAFTELISPLTTGLLRLPSEAGVTFIMGMIRRDFGVAGILHMPLSQGQTLVAAVTLTLFVPCIASLLIMFKERSKLEAAAIWVASVVLAFLAGGVLALLFV